MPIGEAGYKKAVIGCFLRFRAIFGLFKMRLAAKCSDYSVIRAFRGLARLILGL